MDEDLKLKIAKDLLNAAKRIIETGHMNDLLINEFPDSNPNIKIREYRLRIYEIVCEAETAYMRMEREMLGDIDFNSIKVNGNPLSKYPGVAVMVNENAKLLPECEYDFDKQRGMFVKKKNRREHRVNK